MNWITTVWPMVAAACLTLALIHLRIAWGDTRRTPHLFFSLAAVAVAVISAFELTLLRTDDLARYQTELRWAVIPIGIMVASVTGFVWTFFHTGRKWLALTAVGLNWMAQLANLVAPVPAVRQAVALHQVQTFGGVWFTVPTIVNGPWNLVDFASVVLVVLFVLDASIKLWKQGERRRAAIVGGGIIFFFCASRGHALLVEQGIVQTPYLVSFAFLGVIIAMGHELSADVLRASALARELRESERRMDLAARAASLGFWTWDVINDKLWATSNARKMFGFSENEPLNLERVMGVMHPEDREPVRQAIEKSLASGGDYQAEYRVRRPGGETCWIAARGRPESGANQKPALMRGVVRDITERRRSETELQQLRGQISHTGRVTLMGQLAAALAHELNQPLGAILRNAEAAELFLAQNPPPLDELRDIVTDIRKDDQRAGAVIDRLRVLLQRRDLVELRAVNLGELAGEVAKLTRPDAMSRRITISVEVPAGLPAVRGDSVHLQQVLLNLLTNAMDAVDGVPAEKRRVTLQAHCDGAEFMEVAVSDMGGGILPDKMSRIFDPFFTTKANGMGMGLAISRTIIEAHGGRIWAENRQDGGATFRFTLPISKEESKHE